jgi:hypothetical protein
MINDSEATSVPVSECRCRDQEQTRIGAVPASAFPDSSLLFLSANAPVDLMRDADAVSVRVTRHLSEAIADSQA